MGNYNADNKVIFTDIAGTLNGNTRNTLSTRSIHVLNKTVEKTGAKLVIISSWRLHKPLSELQDLFFNYGFSGEIIGVTEDLFPVSREDEVKQYIYDYYISHFVILDDVNDYPTLSHKVVYTDPSQGIDYCHYDKIINILSHASKTTGVVG